MKIVWNLISLSISLWSRLLISLIKLHVSKLATISNKAMVATKKYSNQRGFSSLICSIKLSVLLFIILMLIVLMPNINRLKIFGDSWHSRLSYLHGYLPPKDDIHYFCLLIIFRTRNQWPFGPQLRGATAHWTYLNHSGLTSAHLRKFGSCGANIL